MDPCISGPDADGDGVSDACDRCRGTVHGRVVSALGCAREQVDPDVDFVCSGGVLDAAYCVATGDNCATVPNRSQRNSDADGLGDVSARSSGGVVVAGTASALSGVMRRCSTWMCA